MMNFLNIFLLFGEFNYYAFLIFEQNFWWDWKKFNPSNHCKYCYF